MLRAVLRDARAAANKIGLGAPVSLHILQYADAITQALTPDENVQE